MAFVFSVIFPFLMLSSSSSTLFLSVLVTAQPSRAPHGLAFENPMSLSPSAFDFFHPKHTTPPAAAAHASAPCDELECAHLADLSASSKARAEPAVLSMTPPSSSNGTVAAIVVGLAFVVLVAMGASYVVVVKRRANSRKASINSIKLDA